MNGKFEYGDQYPYDFHYYFDERIVTMYLVVPGIIPNSVRISITTYNIEITASIKKQFVKLYNTQQISLSGNIPCKLHQNTMFCKYIDGILIVELAKDLQVE